MYCIKNVTEDILWIGANDRRIGLFENVYPVPDGVSYNSYLILDEKTAVLDTVDKAVSGRFFENLAQGLNGRKLDYLIVNHMEPDHCAAMAELVLRYPEVKIVGNAKTFAMIKQFFDFDIDSRSITVAEGDTLSLGAHTLTFLMAPMVHWPEAMVTFDSASGVLFSADAFGTFGALGGNLFADQVDFENEGLAEARRYYTNIVGKYGVQVQALLKKASAVDIKMICPLHGPVWRENIGWFVDKYKLWSSYTPEEKAVVIAYASIYGNTENAAEVLAGMLADKGVRNVKLYDVSSTHPSKIIAEIFRCSHLVLASPTYNGGIFSSMETLVCDIVAHNIQNRTVGVIENGTWAAASGKKIRTMLEPLKGIKLLEDTVSIRSAVKNEQRNQLSAMADELCEELL